MATKIEQLEEVLNCYYEPKWYRIKYADGTSIPFARVIKDPNLDAVYTKLQSEQIYKHLYHLAMVQGMMEKSLWYGVRDVPKGEKYHNKFIGGSGLSPEPYSAKEPRKIGTEFFYNEETDTFLTWGWGIIILYEKGVWATKA